MSSPPLVGGGRERLWPVDCVHGVRCFVQCSVEAIGVGKPLVISPSLLVEGGMEKLVKRGGCSEVVGVQQLMAMVEPMYGMMSN